MFELPFICFLGTLSSTETMQRVAQFTTASSDGQRGVRQLRLAATPDEFQAWLATWLPWITGADVSLHATVHAGATEGSRHACALTVPWPCEPARSILCRCVRAGPSEGAAKKSTACLALGTASGKHVQSSIGWFQGICQENCDADAVLWPQRARVSVLPGLWGAALLGACALDAAQALRPGAAEARPAGAASGADAAGVLQAGMRARSPARTLLPTGVSCSPTLCSNLRSMACGVVADFLIPARAGRGLLMLL